MLTAACNYLIGPSEAQTQGGYTPPIKPKGRCCSLSSLVQNILSCCSSRENDWSDISVEKAFERGHQAKDLSPEPLDTVKREACPLLFHPYLRAKTLDLSWQTQLSEEQIVKRIQSRSELWAIRLEGLAITKKTLEAIAQYQPQLRILDVKLCGYLDQEAFDALSEGCTQIEVLNTSQLDCLQDGALAKLFTTLASSLRIWEADFCSGLGQENLGALAQCAELKLFNANLAYSDPEALKTLFSSSPSLEAVNLQGCSGVTVDLIQSLPNLTPKLRSLQVDVSERVSPDVVSSVVQSLPCLQDLNLLASLGCSFDDTQFLALLQKQLRRLKISNGMLSVSNEALGSIPQRAPHLTALGLSNLIAGKAPNLLPNLLQQLPCLRELQLSNSEISGSFLTPELSGKLLQLHLSDCDIRHSDNWQNLSPGALKIRRLTLSGTLDSAPTGSNPIFSLLTACPELHYLYLNCGEQSQEALGMLKESDLTNLRDIEVVQPDQIHQANFADFLSQNPHLKKVYLWVRSGDALVGNDLMMALSQLPQLEQLCCGVNDSCSMVGDRPFPSLKFMILGQVSPPLVDSLEAILRESPLARLGLYNAKLDEETMQSLTSINRNLEQINLQEDPFSDLALLEVLKESPRLMEVILNSCPGVTQQGVDLAQKLFPKVNISFTPYDTGS